MVVLEGLHGAASLFEDHSLRHPLLPLLHLRLLLFSLEKVSWRHLATVVLVVLVVLWKVAVLVKLGFDFVDTDRLLLSELGSEFAEGLGASERLDEPHGAVDGQVAETAAGAV